MDADFPLVLRIVLYRLSDQDPVLKKGPENKDGSKHTRNDDSSSTNMKSDEQQSNHKIRFSKHQIIKL